MELWNKIYIYIFLHILVLLAYIFFFFYSRIHKLYKVLNTQVFI